jgi:hypothetical protein
LSKKNILLVTNLKKRKCKKKIEQIAKFYYPYFSSLICSNVNKTRVAAICTKCTGTGRCSLNCCPLRRMLQICAGCAGAGIYLQFSFSEVVR